MYEQSSVINCRHFSTWLDAFERSRDVALFFIRTYLYFICVHVCWQMFIQSTGGGSDYLPVAHTCFNLLDLPQYRDKVTLRDKLLQAMEETEGFGLV